MQNGSHVIAPPQLLLVVRNADGAWRAEYVGISWGRGWWFAPICSAPAQAKKRLRHLLTSVLCWKYRCPLPPLRKASLRKWMGIGRNDTGTRAFPHFRLESRQTTLATEWFDGKGNVRRRDRDRDLLVFDWPECGRLLLQVGPNIPLLSLVEFMTKGGFGENVGIQSIDEYSQVEWASPGPCIASIERDLAGSGTDDARTERWRHELLGSSATAEKRDRALAVLRPPPETTPGAIAVEREPRPDGSGTRLSVPPKRSKARRSGQGATDAEPPTSERGLRQFLRMLGQQNNVVDTRRYETIDEVFVPPNEFDHVCCLLKQHRIVFVLGAPHVGKTFTAVALLRRYCDPAEGRPRELKWLLPKPLTPEPWPDVRLAEPRNEFDDSLLERVARDTGKDKVTYIEDPFGKFSREAATWRRLRPDQFADKLLSIAENREHDARIIVTSRDKIFDAVAGVDKRLERVAVRLRPSPFWSFGSYRCDGAGNWVDKLEDLIGRYAQQHACKWREHALVKDMTSQISARVSTPKAVDLFCALSRNATSIKEAVSHVDQAAQEIVKGFANEIVDLDDGLLAFVLVCQYASGRCLSLRHVYLALRSQISGGKWKTWRDSTREMEDRIECTGPLSTEPKYVDYWTAVDIAVSTQRVRRLLKEMLEAIKRKPAKLMHIPTHPYEIPRLCEDWEALLATPPTI